MKEVRAKSAPRNGTIAVPRRTPATLLNLDMTWTTRSAVTILATRRKTSWTESGFRGSWGKARKKAGAEGVTFHDLGGTAVTRLAVVGCSVPEIASITGHSLKQVTAILDAHCLSRDSALGVFAIQKLEAQGQGTKFPS